MKPNINVDNAYCADINALLTEKMCVFFRSPLNAHNLFRLKFVNMPGLFCWKVGSVQSIHNR